jgi:hypothetical protein
MTPRHIARMGLAVGLCCSLLSGPLSAADCQSEVDPAHPRFARSDQPYRIETTETFSGIYRLMEVVPPDRMHQLITEDKRQMRREMIRIGKRAWGSAEGQGLGKDTQDQWYEMANVKPDSWVTMAYREPIVHPIQLTFECLGSVEFSGKSYTGYRARYPFPRILVESWFSHGREKDPAPTPDRPPLWYTILVDPDTGLWAYEVIAEENQLDKPQLITRYTHPADIMIEPPVK